MAGRKGREPSSGKRSGGRGRSAQASQTPAKTAAEPSAPREGRGRRDAGRSAPTSGTFLYGIHAVEAALKNPSRKVHEVLGTTAALKRIGSSGRTSIPRREVQPSDLDGLLGDAVHQGLAARVEPLPPLALDDVLKMGRIVLLDQITDPHNLGAILRSAAAFGIEAVITTERHAPAATGLVAKTASGAMERVPLVRVTNLARSLDALKDAGFFCVGLAGETDVPLEDALNGADRLALVMGAEGPGLRRLTRERCDMLARIPMTDAMESLNVSNAAAIAFYAASRTTLAPRASRD